MKRCIFLLWALFYLLFRPAESSASHSLWTNPHTPKRSVSYLERFPLFSRSSDDNIDINRVLFFRGGDKKKRSNITIVISPGWARFFYTLTALNPLIAVIFNDYSKMLEPVKQIQTYTRLARTYETIFFFARLRPRVSFAIGAILRGLQLTTALQYMFDPSAGVGFGLNLLCLFAKSRWPAVTVLGWSGTKIIWKMLGARPPVGPAVPITISMRKER